MYCSKNLKGKILADGEFYNPRIHRRLLTVQVLCKHAFDLTEGQFRVSSFLTKIMKDYDRLWKIQHREPIAKKLVDMYCAELNSAAAKACEVLDLHTCSFFKLMKTYGMTWTRITYKAISTTLKNIRTAFENEQVDRRALEHTLWNSREQLARIYKISGNYFAIRDIAALPDYFKGILPDELIAECGQIVMSASFNEEQILNFFDQRITPDMYEKIKSRICNMQCSGYETHFFG